jgi:hypothetical protein
VAGADYRVLARVVGRDRGFLVAVEHREKPAGAYAAVDVLRRIHDVLDAEAACRPA